MVRSPEMVALDLRSMIACHNVARERILALLEKYGAEIVNESCRALMPINKLTHDLRQIGVPIIWVLHANSQGGGRSDWELFFNYVVADQVRERTLQSLAPGRQKVWSGLTIDPADTTVIKKRYSALIPGSSSLERLLRSLDIDTHSHRRDQDEHMLRSDRPRRHDARFQSGDGIGLLCGFVRRRASLGVGEHHSAVRGCHDRRRSFGAPPPPDQSITLSSHARGSQTARSTG